MSKKRDEEEKFIYFNTRRLPEDVYSSEFAFSLIYNNIAPNRVQEAIDTVGLSRLPNVFFVVSVDDYSNESKKFQIRWEYTLKYEVLCVIRKYIERKGYEGLVANLIGTDQLACFFCMEMEETEESYEFLTHMAYEICREVKRLTSYTISICVTDFCDSVIKFADEYEKASLAFRESFYLGKEVQIRVVSNDGDDMQNSLEALLDRTM